uniref:Uncharacterized protein n=1 Tax=Rhizophora mucronata TaxID=61149 RepID=A0A2P2PQG3_RHIMU
MANAIVAIVPMINHLEGCLMLEKNYSSSLENLRRKIDN